MSADALITAGAKEWADQLTPDEQIGAALLQELLEVGHGIGVRDNSGVDLSLLIEGEVPTIEDPNRHAELPPK